MTTPTDRAAPRKGNVKARRMWHLQYADADTLHHTEREAQKIADNCEYLEGYPPHKKPVFVLPADAASYERMVEQMARPIHEASKRHKGIQLKDHPWSDVTLHNQEGYRNVARAALASLGIQPPAAQPRRTGEKKEPTP